MTNRWKIHIIETLIIIVSSTDLGKPYSNGDERIDSSTKYRMDWSNAWKTKERNNRTVQRRFHGTDIWKPNHKWTQGHTTLTFITVVESCAHRSEAQTRTDGQRSKPLHQVVWNVEHQRRERPLGNRSARVITTSRVYFGSSELYSGTFHTQASESA